MKSGILNPRDTYGMDPHLFVDPNLILDYDSSLKDEANYFDSNIMEFVQSSDTQLENIILNGNLCDELSLDLFAFGECRDDTFHCEDDYGFNYSPNNQTVTPVDVDIGHYEEVITSNVSDSYSCSSGSPMSADINQYSDNNDNDSLNSSSYSVKSTGIKKKATKIGKSLKRPRRVHDDRIKHQNKVAAVKYRKRKRDELQILEGEMEEEEERNKILKTNVKELKMQIKIIKDLIGKHMPNSQLPAQPSQQSTSQRQP